MPSKLTNSAQIFIQYVLVLSVALASPFQVVLAQEETENAAESVEEVVVYGERSLTNLRSEMYSAQEDFFNVFNSLNSRDEFDINCDFQTILGERRRYHVCTPQFATKLEAAASARYIQSLQLAAAQLEVPDFEAARSGTFSQDSRTRKKEEMMWREMKTLLSEHAELREALNEVARARHSYESARGKD